ncbi:FliH/SctL family protein [Pontibaca salina]|uniref:ABC transporter ATP-binding protein n=1 Tax=Pontibaca salina TaxID=2795731 RepID=A0A934LZE6_9RHOB|nr:ABC transporter ATP-binding protein [Pontibaca salina]MBI6628915.1 ABC transporter ATP-binding protein [Pontibaca salina]
MPISHHLEDFSSEDSPTSSTGLISIKALEDQNLDNFEQGYSAGWEDAISAQAENRAQISAALGRSLENMSLTYHEVRTQLLASLQPLFEDLVSAVLPETMMRVFGYRIVDQLYTLTKEQTAQPVVIAVAPGESTGLKELIAQGFALLIEVHEDDDLDPGMAIIRLNSHEYELDSSELLASINQSVTSFFYHINQENTNG